MITPSEFYWFGVLLACVIGTAGGVLVYRIGAYCARFETKNSPMLGDTLPGGLPGVSLKVEK